MQNNLINKINPKMSPTELFFAVVSTALGLLLIFYIIPSQVTVSNPSPPNAQTFPYLIASIYALLSLFWLFGIIMGKENGKKLINTRSLLAGLLIGCLFIIFSFLIQTIGYIIGGTLAVIFVTFAINGFKKWLWFSLVGLGLTVIYYLFFIKVMKIELYSGLAFFGGI